MSGERLADISFLSGSILLSGAHIAVPPFTDGD
jgi:hypothetical protein